MRFTIYKIYFTFVLPSWGPTKPKYPVQHAYALKYQRQTPLFQPITLDLLTQRFPHLSAIACFPTLLTTLLTSGYKCSRVCHWFYIVFPQLPLVTSFPALVACYLFSRAYYGLYVFPRLPLAVCFPAPASGLQVFPRFAPINVFPPLLLISCFRSEFWLVYCTCCLIIADVLMVIVSVISLAFIFFVGLSTTGIK